MPFLGGSLAFERYNVSGFDGSMFSEDQMEILQNYSAGQTQTSSTENVHVGFLGGQHLFDTDFDLAKNIINDALHCGVRIDTNQIPAAIRKAWLQMELSRSGQDNASGVPTKAQRKEAKEAVEQRCEVEAATGKYRRMQQFPILWDAASQMLYFGGSFGNASGHCADLLERTFEIELRHVSAGSLALQWGATNTQLAAVEDLVPACFVPGKQYGMPTWTSEHSQAPDFLGNEFLLWLWWTTEHQSENIDLPDDSDVTVMLTKTLSLECPAGESGKESISALAPTQLPEAFQAVRSGKLPRKSGITAVRHGRQFDLVLQAETFGISGAKIHVESDEEFGVEDRIDAIRLLSETIDLMFFSFCARRVSKAWASDLTKITEWLTGDSAKAGKSAAA
ncbi:MAG: hypothetical protein R3C05_08020 [Pirellulaceae bacterium]